MKKNTQGFKQFQEYVLNSGYKCSDENGSIVIGNEYLKDTIEQCDYIVAATNTYLNRKTRSGKTPNYRTLLGFACVTIPPKNNHVYVDLICGKGSGKIIFKDIEELAKSLGKTKIKLSAIPTAMMAYYGAHGFKFTERDNCQEANNIRDAAVALNSLIKERIKLVKNAETQQIKPDKQRLRMLTRHIKRTSNILQDGLIELQLTADKQCRTKSDCGENGYTMTKCLT